MTDTRHFPARPDAPIVCDMTTAEDTVEERLAEYAALFRRALLRRERDPGGVHFVFRAGAGVRDKVEDLARREALCCPFLAYRVETAGGEVTYSILNPLTGDDRAAVDAELDVIHALPEHAGTSRVA
jgi:hypothetical protein